MTAARLLLAGFGAATFRALSAGAHRGPGHGKWPERPSYRGQQVSLVGGPILAAAASLSAYAAAPRSPVGRAALLAGLAAGTIGGYDDLFGSRSAGSADKGVRGHLGALLQGRISTGLVKVVGISAAGLMAAPAVATGGVDVVVTGGIIAGSANLVNLLDLRPGRALKAGLLIGLPMVPGPAGALMAGPLGAAAAALPDDLGERTMLGDSGANALGAVLGLGLAASTGRAGRAALLAVLLALTAASERVSFTALIERTPALRHLDMLGRRQPAAGG